MDRKCVMGAFYQFNAANKLRNDLLNNGFDQIDISVAYGDEFKARHYATTLGPLTGITSENVRQKIVHLGFGTGLAREYEGYLYEGCSIVAALVEEEDVQDTMELFQNYTAFDVQVSD